MQSMHINLYFRINPIPGLEIDKGGCTGNLVSMWHMRGGDEVIFEVTLGGGKVIFDVTLGGAKGFLTEYQSLYGKNVAKKILHASRAFINILQRFH